MPTINKKRKVNPLESINKPLNSKELAQKLVYNTPQWKSLRISKLQSNPLCEKCLENDKITAATEVHHIQPFMSGITVEHIKYLGFDPANLLSLCSLCHQSIHKGEGG